jgi:flagellar motility protein MotE (MotC chaperone)
MNTSAFLRVRFLPIAIAVAFVVLALRVGAMFFASGAAQAQAPAQPQNQARPPAAAPATPAAPAAAGGAQRPATPAAAPAVPAPAAPAAAAGETQDITDLSGAEIEVLQQLAARRSEIDKRAADLERREAVLRAAEERIDAKIQELKKLQGNVEQAISRYDDQETKRIENLVRLYETMKPSEAARIMEQLDLNTLVALAERMSTRKLAPVLAGMNPVRAKQVTTELSKRRKPGDAPEAPAPQALAVPGLPSLPLPTPPQPAGG